MAFTLGEYQDIFLEEADEQLQELNQNLLELERNPGNFDTINNIFRAAHSLKSSAAFVGLNDLSDLAHKMENLLQGIRDKTMEVGPEIVDVLFMCFDVISSVITTVASGEKPTQDLSDITSRIQNISESSLGRNVPKQEIQPADTGDEIPRTAFNRHEMKLIREALEAGVSCCEVTIFIDPSALMKWVKAQLILTNLEKLGNIVKTVPPIDEINDRGMRDVFRAILLTEHRLEDVRRACDVDLVNRIDLKKISLGRKDDKLVLKFHEKESFVDEDEERGEAAMSASSVYLDKDMDDEEEEELEPGQGLEKVGFDRRKSDKKAPVFRTVKVSVDKLDLLLNNVGELVIANSGFYRLYEEMRRRGFDKATINEFKNRMEQMSRIAKDLQGGIMKTRMVPIGQIFSRFNRPVRDLSKEFNKKVKLDIKGEDTELDKKVIDSIGEPLMHLIRNAIDHGIETPEERRSLGKSEIATVILNAYQGGNQILVEVSDDGKGLNLPKIRRKIMEMDLATSEMLANMDDDEILNFIFTPGFSTADIVTDISGRGVGMNVVKEIVSELNGNVSIETEPGMGTRFILTFPLTLAIIPAIMVKVRKEMYAIPLSDVIETIKIAQEDINTIEGHEVINLRGEILSLLRLNEFIGITSGLASKDKMPVVVVGFGNRKIGLIVDYLEGKQEIVIKSLDQNYTTVEGLAGASILGDGSICLILDISSMINKVVSEQDKLSRRERIRLMESREASLEEVKGKAEIEEAPRRTQEFAGRAAAEANKEREPKKDIEKRETVIEKASRPEMIPEKKEEEIKEDIIFEKKDQPPAGGADEAPGTNDDIERRVKETLEEFRHELKEKIKGTMDEGQIDEHIKKTLQIDDDDLSRVRVLANVGITHAAESLSKILNKQVDLSIPEVKILPIEKIPEEIGEVDSVYIGVYMPLIGGVKGTILFSLREEAGFELIDMLYGTETGKTKELTEDGESALREVTNIIGSSVINVFSEKVAILIKPTVPTVIHDFMQSTLDSILVMHNIANDYALVMDTEFFYQNDKVIGNLMILPETESLKKIVEKLRS